MGPRVPKWGLKWIKSILIDQQRSSLFSVIKKLSQIGTGNVQTVCLKAQGKGSEKKQFFLDKFQTADPTHPPLQFKTFLRKLTEIMNDQICHLNMTW